jgi:acyl-CoA thioesterase-2
VGQSSTGVTRIESNEFSLTTPDLEVMKLMSSPIDLADLLDLAPSGARTDEHIFVGHTPSTERGRVFGGQVLAQGIVAASRTVDEDRHIHSLHGYFLRPGDIEEPITYGVSTLRDGRSFSARRVHAYQGGVPILSLIASFELPGSGPSYQDPMPADVPDPESLPSAAETLAGVDHPMAREWGIVRPFDLRYPDGPAFVSTNGVTERNLVWIKLKDTFEAPTNLQRAALAYASDYTLIETALRRAGESWLSAAGKRMHMASLDHAMWWHRPARADEWLLYVQDATTAQDSRALIRGSIFNRSGDLVATVAQEGMVRLD